jgi:hypothetical protein
MQAAITVNGTCIVNGQQLKIQMVEQVAQVGMAEEDLVMTEQQLQAQLEVTEQQGELMLVLVEKVVRAEQEEPGEQLAARERSALPARAATEQEERQGERAAQEEQLVMPFM